MVVGMMYVGTRVHQSIVRYQHYRNTELVAYQPLIEEQKAITRPVVTRSTPIPKTKTAVVEKPATPALIVTPQIRVVSGHKRIEPEFVAPPEIKLESKKLTIPSAPTAAVVAVGTFSHESPVTAPVAKLAETVRPGGFGDPNAAVASGPHGSGNTSGKGSFGSGDGFGQGRGTGSGTGNGQVSSSGFGNGGIDVAGVRPKAAPQTGTEATSPVEITFKPKPDYTDEGRKQKINGEVRLEVLFKSDGRVVVTKVLSGLGYGLDEQAVKAAQQIKFKPAKREGQPVDSMAQIHIIFELIS